MHIFDTKVELAIEVAKDSIDSRKIEDISFSSFLFSLKEPIRIHHRAHDFNHPDRARQQSWIGKNYGTNHPQLKQSMHVTHVSHACVTRGVTHKRVCILDSTCVYTHTQYYTRVYVCMATVAIDCLA